MTKALQLSSGLPTTDEMQMYCMIAKSIAKTPYWDKMGGEGGVLGTMLMGRELGIPPMLSVSGMLHPIQGKMEMSARGINYVIRRAGHSIELLHFTPTKCVLKGVRGDTGNTMEVTYTIEDATLAGLVKPYSNWIKHPKDMLYARASSRLGRWLFTDCLGPCYVEGELKEIFEKETQVEKPAIDLAPPPEEPELILPEDLTSVQVNEYVEYISKEYDTPRLGIMQAAQARSEEFYNKVRSFLGAGEEVTNE